MSDRLEVRKTYKLFLNGGFPRSESGRSYEVRSESGALVANAVRASRKDVRDAVAAALAAADGWAALTAYNRGQVLYRIAEMMEARRDDLRREIERVDETSAARDAAEQVDGAIDAWVWYAGWTDKIAQVMGGLNPVAGPYFNLTIPEPAGVVGIVAPEQPALLGLVERLGPALAGGNAVVALASETNPLPALALAECLATSDLPPGTVNLLTGSRAELVPVLAGHGAVDRLDVTGVPPDLRAEAEAAAAGNVKGLVRSSGRRSPYEVTAFMQLKTVWHPKGP